MSRTYVYVHGFNSSCQSTSAQRLEEALQLPIHRLDYKSQNTFKENLDQLALQVKDLEEVFLIGTSLGGFYADQLLFTIGYPKACGCALFNPVVHPCDQLAQFLGKNKNFTTDEEYIFTKPTLASYADAPDTRGLQIPRVVYIAHDDELLDPLVALEYWKGHSKVVDIKGGHRISSFRPYAQEILGM
ncbi:MAG: YqiA/YcfP family alpha/beta fold hydrolase [Desulfovibrio sp.]|uniref:YqiA/YcfP family alpha/beta fold hydrolase n=1 Tax=Desulfovibrio sp. 7SRBS1 TaxID=3378064 RepID=UPI003B419A23